MAYQFAKLRILGFYYDWLCREKRLCADSERHRKFVQDTACRSNSGGNQRRSGRRKTQ